MFRFIVNVLIIVFLTFLTQIGGIAWLFALPFKYKKSVFLVLYAVFTIATLWIAPIFGRVPISCDSETNLQTRSWVFCALNRQYVSKDMLVVAEDLADNINEIYPDTKTLALDGNFPFLNGFPMLPHLSHMDGDKLDLAFFYDNDGVFLPGKTRSPIGYFAFEEGPSECYNDWLTLRWNFNGFQRFWADYQLDDPRMKIMLDLIAQERRISKVFLEPHLTKKYGITSHKFRFQGCRAARHDDHIHIQL